MTNKCPITKNQAQQALAFGPCDFVGHCGLVIRMATILRKAFLMYVNTDQHAEYSEGDTTLHIKGPVPFNYAPSDDNEQP